MNISRNSLTRLALCSALALTLNACSSDGTSGTSSNSTAQSQNNNAGTNGSGSGTDGTTNTGTTGGSGTTAPNALSPVQSQLSALIATLGGQLKNTPLQGFVLCLDPTLNQLITGPGVLLSNLQTSASNPASLPAALGNGGTALSTSIQSLTINLPKALMALAGQGSCTSTTGSATGGTATPLDQLIALIKANGATGTPLDTLIKGMPSTGGSTQPTGTPLDVILGPLQQLATGNTGNTSQGQLLDMLGQGLSSLGVAIAAQSPAGTPVVTPLVVTLATTVIDLGNTLNQLESTQTANDLQKTLNDLLVNVNNLLTGPQGLLGAPATAAGQYAQLQPVNQQINGAVAQVTTALGSTLLQPIAGQNGLLPTLLFALQPLTCPLMLTGNCNASAARTATLIRN